MLDPAAETVKEAFVIVGAAYPDAVVPVQRITYVPAARFASIVKALEYPTSSESNA